MPARALEHRAGQDTGGPFRQLLADQVGNPDASRGHPMPRPFAERYGGDLAIPLRADRPTVVANFVSTLDGVVAFDADGASGGGEISGFSEPDRFVMGLLRALADVVVVGAGTLRAAPEHAWIAGHVHPASAPLFMAWRRAIGLTASHPTTIVVTGQGDLPHDHPGLRDASIPVVVVTTGAGARRVGRLGFGANVEIRVGRAVDRVSPWDIVSVADELGARLVLCEGGPHVVGQFVGAGLLDELFLTVAPQIAGRAAASPRLGMIEGTAFSVDTATWAELRSVHSSGDHLFLRYAMPSALRIVV
jgi:riboflavin biosynthesis pyrimidine reductase